MIRLKGIAIASVAVSSALLLAACGSSSTSSESTAAASSTAAAASPAAAGDCVPADAAGTTEVFSWWTSGSESAALDALFAQTKTDFPNVELQNAAVAGGAGTNAQQVLATRLAGGDVPETWQTHPGGALGDYVDQGVVSDLSTLYTCEGWDKVVPTELVDSMSYDGKVYAALTGVHRANVLWYNKPLVEGAGVTVPANMTWADFSAIAKQLQDKGITPICLGDKDIWTAAQLLEEIIVGEVGADGWKALLDGSLSWSDPKVQTAVENFNTALGMTNKDHKNLDWAGAVAALADGKCAFNLMGDWAYGELTTKLKKVDGTDFGYTVLGDPNTFVTVGDAFVVGEGSKNPAGAQAYIAALMSPEGQIAFNKLKGSSPVRSDVDTSQLGTYQQGAAATLTNGTKVASLVHGQALVPAADSQALSDNTTLLQAKGDAAAFGAAMDKAFAANKNS
jgi:glucose/mannose transport system substrate-binding protein